MLSAKEYKKLNEAIEALKQMTQGADLEASKFCQQSQCDECPLRYTECRTIDYLEYIEER